MNASRWLRIGLAACLCFLLAAPPSRGKEPETFYYLAIPSAPGKCLFFASLQFDLAGKPVAASPKARFFTLWRSGYWDERAPDLPVKTAEEWTRALELRARKTLAAKKEMSLIPPPLVEFFVAVETLRAGALDQALVVHPLFQAKGFAGWENTSHLNLLATPDTLGPKERSRQLLRSMGAASRELDQDSAQWIKTLFSAFGMPLRSVRYWPEYNVFLFEADGRFKEKAETVFSPF